MISGLFASTHSGAIACSIVTRSAVLAPLARSCTTLAPGPPRDLAPSPARVMSATA